MSGYTSIRGRADQIEKQLRRKGMDLELKKEKKESVWAHWPRLLLLYGLCYWPRHIPYSEEIRANLLKSGWDPDAPFPLRRWIPEERYIKEHPEEEDSKAFMKKWGLNR